MAKKTRDGEKEHHVESPDVPVGIPFTLYFPRRGGYAAADIEYPAPLPRVGDTIEYLDHVGTTHRYEVIEVVQAFQSPPEAADGTGLLRAGLPAVYLTRSRRKSRRPS